MPCCLPNNSFVGLQKDSSDARSFSFLNILELIPQLSFAPHMLFVENVVGFEVLLKEPYLGIHWCILNSNCYWNIFLFFLQTSNTHNKMVEVLTKTGYFIQEFILSPLQFGVPYSRPRYFCLVSCSLPIFLCHLSKMGKNTKN